MRNRENTYSVESLSFQQDPQTRDQAKNPTSISNISFAPPPFSSSSALPPPPPPPTNASHLRPAPAQNSSLYSRAVSYPRQENFPLPLRDVYHAQQVSPGVENDNFQETVYVTPADNQIEVFNSGLTSKRKSSNGQGKIENSNLLY